MVEVRGLPGIIRVLAGRRADEGKAAIAGQVLGW